MSELKDKVAIVTGAGRGIGRGIALRYGAEGMKVIVASRTKATVDKVVEEIVASGGVARGLSCDVGYKDQLQAVVDQTIDAFGRIDVLVNNAQGFGTEKAPAGSPVTTPLEDYDDEQWEYSFRTGATATLWGMKAVFPHMKKQGGGRIINFGSEYGVVGWEGAAAYNATKEAIRALTRTAAREWGRHGVNVNCINPVVLTEGAESTGTDVKAVAQRIPVRRWGDPFKDAGGLAVILAGDDSTFMTGMTFFLDGGLTTRA